MAARELELDHPGGTLARGLARGRARPSPWALRWMSFRNGSGAMSELSIAERQPFVEKVIEVPDHSAAVPVILEMAFLCRTADDIGPERRDALSFRIPHAWIDEPVAARRAERPGEGLACSVGVRIQDRRTLGGAQRADVVELVRDGADENPHVPATGWVVRVPRDALKRQAVSLIAVLKRSAA